MATSVTIPRQLPEAQQPQAPSERFNPFVRLDNSMAYLEQTLNYAGYFPTALLSSVVRYNLGYAQVALAFIGAFHQLVTSSENRLSNSTNIFTKYLASGLGNIGRSFLEILPGMFTYLFVYDNLPMGLPRAELGWASKTSWRPTFSASLPRGFRITLPKEKHSGVEVTPGQALIIATKVAKVAYQVPSLLLAVI